MKRHYAVRVPVYAVIGNSRVHIRGRLSCSAVRVPVRLARTKNT